MITVKSKVLIVSGSYRTQSQTRITMKYVEALVAKAGLSPELICARELDLPIFDPPSAETLPKAKRWRDAVQSSAGIIFGSPEYHGACSGVLKNMIDYLDFPHIEGKPIALVSAAGGPRSGFGTLTALRLVFRALHAPVIVEQAMVYGGDFGATQQIKPEAYKQLRGVVEGLRREIRRNEHPLEEVFPDALSMSQELTA